MIVALDDCRGSSADDSSDEEDELAALILGAVHTPAMMNAKVELIARPQTQPGHRQHGGEPVLHLVPLPQSRLLGASLPS